MQQHNTAEMMIITVNQVGLRPRTQTWTRGSCSLWILPSAVIFTIQRTIFRCWMNIVWFGTIRAIQRRGIWWNSRRSRLRNYTIGVDFPPGICWIHHRLLNSMVIDFLFVFSSRFRLHLFKELGQHMFSNQFKIQSRTKFTHFNYKKSNFRGIKQCRSMQTRGENAYMPRIYTLNLHKFIRFKRLFSHLNQFLNPFTISSKQNSKIEKKNQHTSGKFTAGWALLQSPSKKITSLKNQNPEVNSIDHDFTEFREQNLTWAKKIRIEQNQRRSRWKRSDSEHPTAGRNGEFRRRKVKLARRKP